MTEKLHLTPGERTFFGLVHHAVLANPFSDARVETDLKIAGMFPGISRDALIEKTISEVRLRIKKLEAKGGGDIRQYSGKDREYLFSSHLFDIFHFFVDRFDKLIVHQIKTDLIPITVPFADEAFALLNQRGFTPEEARHAFALCYQLRRAFYFIDRGLVGNSASMKKFRESLWNNVFTSDLNLYKRYLWNRMEDFSTLILGETGTGKGAAAMAIGQSGYIPFDAKKKAFTESFTRSFVSLNLSQFPSNLIESELFGHKKGAFTGAVDDHKGIFARCSPHGAIFLDEIGEVSCPLQIKLLKVLEERVFCPVGSHREIRFKGRIIAATNRPLADLQSGAFLRDDFFYRLCSDIITAPPLRERISEDPTELDDLLINTVTRITGRSAPELADMVKDIIDRELGKDYTWPGNVRELAQCVRRVLLKRSYQPPYAHIAERQPHQLSEVIGRGDIDARSLVREYSRHLYEKFGTYGEVSRRTGLDRRTVKKHITEDTE